jgi:murein DD-endopeptidase MepM/ murein hydrolase activator NlpD
VTIAFHRRALLALPALSTLPAAAQAAYSQGSLVIGRVAPGTKLVLDGKPLRVGPGGEYVFGFGRDHGPSSTLTVTPPGGRPQQQNIEVLKRPWKVQKISGLPPGQVNPDPAQLARIERERTHLAEVRAIDSPLTGFANGFVLPTQGRVSGVFGSQRVLNGEPRMPHFGFDLAVGVGTPLAAIGAGRITLADHYFFFGKLVVIDHGHGVNSLYAHCSELECSTGQLVEAGQRVALSGATGRVTGPHLHFGLSWFTTWVDPQAALPPVG